MRKSLLLGITALFLVLSAVGANAVTPADQASLVALNQQAQAAYPGVVPVEGRAAVAYEDSDQARIGERRESSRAFREGPGGLVGEIIMLGIAGLVFGLGAVGAKALWVLDETEATSHGWPRWFGY